VSALGEALDASHRALPTEQRENSCGPTTVGAVTDGGAGNRLLTSLRRQGSILCYLIACQHNVLRFCGVPAP
jgi:hypothetical protein